MKPYSDKIIFCFLLLCMLVACNEEKPLTVLELFTETRAISTKAAYNINEDNGWDIICYVI